MTTIAFLTEGSRITGFDVKGHSGYAEAGEDIVCAAITSAVRLTEATVNDIFGLAARSGLLPPLGTRGRGSPLRREPFSIRRRDGA